LLVAALVALPALASARTFNGTSGNDKIYFGYCASCVSGGPGLLVCGETAAGGPFAATLNMDTSTLVINGGGGNDYIQAVDKGEGGGCEFGAIGSLTFRDVFIQGGPGNDCILGTKGTQNIDGGLGNDSLWGGEGMDYLHGGDGDDVLIGNQGNDYLSGQGGNDILIGGQGMDVFDGGAGTDTLRCRRVDSATDYDRFRPTTTPSEDCTDDPSDARVSIERYEMRDPYEEWAFITRCQNGVTNHHLTTSSSRLLLGERAAGASILLQAGGDMPLAGDFDRDGRADDTAVFRPTNHVWYYDYGHNGTTNHSRSWALARDRPVVGDFDRDGRLDDVAVFRPSDRKWYFDFNHDGTTDVDSGPWGQAGDIPLAGDFDRDGFVDDVAVFRPSNRKWYFDHDRDGTTNDDSGPWGNAGDIPVAGDFDRDGRMDDVALFRPASHKWFFDHNHDGTTNDDTAPWGGLGDIPVAGDFDGDGWYDDVGVFRLSNRKWYFDHDHDGTTNDDTPPWGDPGAPRAVTHKQYPKTCGPSSLNIVMEHLGMADRSVPMTGLQDLDGTHTDTVPLGYKLSTEHIMYLGYKRYRERRTTWASAIPGFMDDHGKLDSDLADANKNDGTWYEIPYDIGNVTYNHTTGAINGQVQRWMSKGEAVGHDGAGLTDVGLPWVANRYPRGGVRDAYPVNTTVGSGRTFTSLSHLKAVIRGFIDHNIPVVAEVENGGHFNTVVGYWERSDGFWIYTADPLDGWGRPYYRKPMRWRKLKLDGSVLKTGVGLFTGLILYGHGTACSGSGWAREIDRAYGRATLCGYL
jgi:hypothetical protein